MADTNEPRDYQPGKLYDLAVNLKRIIPKPDAYPDVPRVVQGFTENVERLIGLAILPSHLVKIAIITQTLASQSAHLASNKRTVDPTDMSDREIRVAGRVYREKINHAPAYDGPISPKAQAWIKRVYSGTIAKMSGDPASGFEAMISAIIIGAWTTFETVATDLWEDSLNLRPKPLAIAAINNPLKGDSAGQKPEKLRLIELLINEDTDAIAKPGVVMRRAPKFDFNSLFGIRDAYVCVFGKSAAQMFRSRHFANLEVLEGVRNVLVHRGGYIDSRFCSRIKNNREAYGRFGVDASRPEGRFLVDGDIASKLADSSVKACNSLLKFLKQWLANHPLQPEP